MTPGKFLVLAALGIWLVTALVFAVAWAIDPLGFPVLLLIPFLVIPEMVADEMPSVWLAIIACCIAVAWLVAAVEIWRRSRTRLAWCFFAAWNALLIIGYYSLHKALRDL